MPPVSPTRPARLLAGGAAIAGVAASFLLMELPQSLFAAGLAILVIVVTVSDLEDFTIPDSASAAILILGFLLRGIEAPTGEVATALLDSALRAAVAGLSLYLLRVAYRRYSGVAGLGLGDVKLAAAAGPWLDWGMLPVALELGALAALIAVGATSLRSRVRPARDLALPFGAFLAPALWLCVMAELGLGWTGLRLG